MTGFEIAALDLLSLDNFERELLCERLRLLAGRMDELGAEQLSGMFCELHTCAVQAVRVARSMDLDLVLSV